MEKVVCNFCQSPALSTVFRSRKVPFAQNFVFDSAQEAMKCLTGQIELVHCQNCGTNFNSLFNGDLIVYDEKYQNEQQHSEAFQHHLHEVLEIIKNKFPNASTSINEVGCGKGYFVNALYDAGYKNIVGYDAAYEGNDPRIIKKLFGPGLGMEATDLLVIRHVLEHIEKPFHFLSLLAEANNYEGSIYIEVPDFTWIVEKMAFWDIYHEHVNYFDSDFFVNNFPSASIFNLFEGQYLGVIVSLSEFKNYTQKPDLSLHVAENMKFDENMKVISERIKGMNELFVWGASSKGVMICNYLDQNKNKIVNLVDINPRKWNKFIPLTGHKVISPAELNSMATHPDSIVLVANSNYRSEIEKLLNGKMKVKCIEDLS